MIKFLYFKLKFNNLQKSKHKKIIVPKRTSFFSCDKIFYISITYKTSLNILKSNEKFKIIKTFKHNYLIFLNFYGLNTFFD